MTEEKLKRFILDEVSDTERSAILKWIYASPNNLQYYLEIRKVCDVSSLNLKTSGPDDIEESYGVLLKKIENKHARRNPFLNKKLVVSLISIAAIVLVILSTYVLFIAPPNSNQINELSYTTVTAVQDSQTYLTLPDGTKVRLNANSELTYASDFGNHERVVNLNGEARFDVTRNEDIPFIVKTEMHDVKVLGTTFNVYAYQNANIFETVLIDGSVNVKNKFKTNSDQIMKPGEILHYNKALGQATIKQADDSATLLWSGGVFAFNNMLITDILDRVSQYKGVEVKFENQRIKQKRYTGKFKNSTRIEHILDVMKADKSFQYRIENDTIYIE